MKIDVLCHDGSPLGVTSKDLWGEGSRGVGVGGSEYALLTMCEAWKNAGHRVRLYNDPVNPRDTLFAQLPIGAYEPKEDRDVVINFRSPNEKTIVSSGLKVWWSCDQYTVNDYAKFAPHVDKIVCISQFHVDYFKRVYNIQNAMHIDLPVRVHDFADMPVEKVPYRLIFTSVPDRGLHYLRDVWTFMKNEIPDLSLVITSDYRLWGLDTPRNEKHRMPWIGVDGVTSLGAVPRRKLIEEQLKADIYSYPNVYDELFCVSCAEAQACGAYPITSGIGALQTTNLGSIINGDPRDGRSAFLKNFRDEIIKLLDDRNALAVKQQSIMEQARERFNTDNVVRKWDEEVFS